MYALLFSVILGLVVELAIFLGWMDGIPAYVPTKNLSSAIIALVGMIASYLLGRMAEGGHPVRSGLAVFVSVFTIKLVVGTVFLLIGMLVQMAG